MCYPSPVVNDEYHRHRQHHHKSSENTAIAAKDNKKQAVKIYKEVAKAEDKMELLSELKDVNLGTVKVHGFILDLKKTRT